MSAVKNSNYSVLHSVESFQDPRPSIKRRMADGKAKRKQVDFVTQGTYVPPEHRISPVEILER